MSLSILLDHPNGYFPGQNVTGRVILSTKKEIEAQFLRIGIKGGAHTEWDERTSNEIRKYRSDLCYVEEEKLAWFPENGNNSFQPGEQSFPFSFLLPADCPPSFAGGYGHIRYRIGVEMGRSSWKFNKRERKDFKVLPNSETDNGAVTKQVEKEIGTIFKKGVVKMTVSIPKQTVVPGEVLPITLEIDNTSKRSCTSIRTEIHQHFHYYHLNPSPTIYSNHRRMQRQQVAENRKPINIESQAHGREKVEFKIPHVRSPTLKCPIIEVRYYLSVELVADALLNNTLHSVFDIIIGADPMSNQATCDSLVSTTSAPPVVHRTESLPPPYPSLTFTTLSAPPSYDESTGCVKIIATHSKCCNFSENTRIDLKFWQ